MRQILARKDLVQLGEIEIGSWRYRYGSLFLSQLRLSPKQLNQIACAMAYERYHKSDFFVQ